MTAQGGKVHRPHRDPLIGNVILVDGTSFSPPYVIQAIGDPAGPARGGCPNPRMVNYQGLRRQVRLGWDMQTKDALSFAPATTSSTVNYATVEETNG